MFTVAGGAALGAFVTVLARTGPGLVLGVCLVAATAAATLAVRPRAVYLIIPVPALAYIIAAIAAGAIHSRGIDTSRAALAVSAAQWIAGGFPAMAVATAMAILATVARWPWRRRGPQDPGRP